MIVGYGYVLVVAIIELLHRAILSLCILNCIFHSTPTGRRPHRPVWRLARHLRDQPAVAQPPDLAQLADHRAEALRLRAGGGARAGRLQSGRRHLGVQARRPHAARAAAGGDWPDCARRGGLCRSAVRPEGAGLNCSPTPIRVDTSR